MPVYRASILLIILLASACEEPAPAETDAQITVPDGALPSADSGPDGGPDAALDGPCGSVDEDVSSDFPPLPSSCLPRCTAETAARVAGCETSTCVFAARSDDPLPTVEVETFWGIYRVSCAGDLGTIWSCETWQSLACQARACPDEYYAWATCEAERPRQCGAERNAVTACMEARPEHASCLRELVPLCDATA